MPIIHPLAPEEVEKIAAGEVVERPVSVVKELIENSLDAQANEIAVEIDDGGKSLIRVTDNGSGILFDELALAVKNFHTSKITLCEDIYHQTTLGFRGEALAAICAISKLTITSRHFSEETGGELTAEGGNIIRIKPIALNVGTSVEVRELFFNTPVRKKFLRGKATETYHISNLLKNYVLAFDNVAFKLISQGRTLLESYGKGLEIGVLSQVFGKSISERLVKFEREYPPLAVRGLIAPPSLFSEERRLQFFFVNKRPVKSRLLFRSVDDALQEFVSPNRYPPLALMLTIPPEEVDVNIHPTKSEVAFMHQQQVYSAVMVAVKDTMREMVGTKKVQVFGEGAQDTLGEIKEEILTSDASGRVAETEGVKTVPLYEMGEPIVPETKVEPFRELVPFTLPSKEDDDYIGSFIPKVEADNLEAVIVNLTPELKVPSFVDTSNNSFVCQLYATYILIVSSESVLLIDQHSAHERIIFDRISSALTSASSTAVERTALLFPLEINADRATLDLLVENLEFITTLGFKVKISDDVILVTEVPSLILSSEVEARAKDVLFDLLHFEKSKKWDNTVKKKLATLACRSAIKAGDKLNPRELRLLVSEVLKTTDWTSCPHGRPVILHFTKSEFEKLFLRT